MTILNQLFNKFSSKEDDRFIRADEYFYSNVFETTHNSTCQCGCVDTIKIFDIFQKDIHTIKEFLEYCFEKNYIERKSEKFQSKYAHGLETIYAKENFDVYVYALRIIQNPIQQIMDNQTSFRDGQLYLSIRTY
jgi:hypothetical protein